MLSWNFFFHRSIVTFVFSASFQNYYYYFIYWHIKNAQILVCSSMNFDTCIWTPMWLLSRSEYQAFLLIFPPSHISSIPQTPYTVPTTISWNSDFSYFVYIPTCGIAGLYVSSFIFKFLRNLHNVFILAVPIYILNSSVQWDGYIRKQDRGSFFHFNYLFFYEMWINKCSVVLNENYYASNTLIYISKTMYIILQNYIRWCLKIILKYLNIKFHSIEI